MSLSGALPRTLQSITATKSFELSKQQALFESRKNAIYTKAAQQASVQDRVKVLLDGLTHLSNGSSPSDDSEGLCNYDTGYLGTGGDGSPLSTQNLEYCRTVRRFLMQSKYDASIDSGLVSQWENYLRQQIDLLSVKHEHGIFFGRLVTEWLRDPNALTSTEMETESDTESSFEQVGRVEMHQQREAWEKLVFEPRKTDPVAIEKYLDKVFSQTKESQEALKNLRTNVKKFGKFNASFDVDSLQWIIPGVIRKDLLSAEKVDILKGLAANDVVAQEVADVLNMRLARLDSWGWSSDVVQVEMKRQLNGKYRMYMDEDILDALFVHYIGVKWAVHFKLRFREIFDSQGWKSNSKTMSKVDKERREYFLRQGGLRENPFSVASKRRQMFENDFFMCQLPESETEDVPVYDGDNQGADKQGKDFIKLKHTLLHLLITEAHLSTSLRGEFTAVQSDFQWFGASLPHTTLLTILKFFGVPDLWLDFFRRFLEAPLKFVHDGADGPVRVRRNGVPLSHSISDWLGETLLFCLDFAVNQYAEGTFLYRMHDDFWFWGREETCAQAWAAVTEFSIVMGLELNREKTGTARLFDDRRQRRFKDRFGPAQSQQSVSTPLTPGRASASLPEGDIKWGFLKLDPVERQFVLDQKQVDIHIEELKRQLDACKSIFAWVRAWNAYLDRFFGNNFGRPALCFGRQHLNMVISTLKHVEHKLFAGTSKNAASESVSGYLRRIIEDRFGVRDLPDGFFYFPVELGGLGLRNPFIPFLAMHESMRKSPDRILDDAFLGVEKAYKSSKEEFDTGGPISSRRFVTGVTRDTPFGVDKSPDSFMPIEEFMKHAESTIGHFRTAYDLLLSEPKEVSVDRSPAVKSAQSGLPALQSSRPPPAISPNWDSMTPYWQWVTELYHGDMLAKYGGLAAVEHGVLPLGVVKILKEGKIRWQG